MATYKIDPMHSEIKFRVKHLMISNVTGEFKTFDATVTAEAADFSDASISFEADINSISTNNEQRDGHLKSDDFFNAEQFPKMTFVSTSVEKTGDDELLVHGNLTIRDVTKPVTLKAEIGGTMVDFYGQTKVGFDVSGTIQRKDFNLSWDAVTEAGGVVVSNDVKLLLAVQFTKQ
ncbi:MAG: YceI family protein [Bacteroidetes bacterium]|uniref:YceI family protein n=1 Tax=Phnomibacter sp. TaxID=2836217 RepID=UPI002FDE2DDA|nr:YceI family protein [Bacteroidota bacterium]